MSDIKDRLLRREAKRILGERTASVVGELREALLKLRVDTGACNANRMSDIHALTHALGALEYWQGRLTNGTFWQRLRWLFTGKIA